MKFNEVLSDDFQNIVNIITFPYFDQTFYVNKFNMQPHRIKWSIDYETLFICDREENRSFEDLRNGEEIESITFSVDRAICLNAITCSKMEIFQDFLDISIEIFECSRRTNNKRSVAQFSAQKYRGKSQIPLPAPLGLSVSSYYMIDVKFQNYETNLFEYYSKDLKNMVTLENGCNVYFHTCKLSGLKIISIISALEFNILSALPQ